MSYNQQVMIRLDYARAVICISRSLDQIPPVPILSWTNRIDGLTALAWLDLNAGVHGKDYGIVQAIVSRRLN